jgi:hypothetical protein
MTQAKNLIEMEVFISVPKGMFTIAKYMQVHTAIYSSNLNSTL